MEVTQTEGSGGADLLEFLKDRKSQSQRSEPAQEITQDLLPRIAPILPKVKIK